MPTAPAELAPRASARAVLVCEEDRDARLALVDLLLSRGYQVQVAIDARQAVYAVMGSPLSCVVLSLPLSGAEPEEVFRSIRGMVGDDIVPVVVLSHPRLLPPVIPGFRPDIDQRLAPSLSGAELLDAVHRAITAATTATTTAASPGAAAGRSIS